MTVVNFAHPLTPQQRAQLEALVGQAVERVIDVKTQFDNDVSFAEQARELVDSVGLSPEDWQTLPILVNLPSLNVIAALVLAELHGRCGYFPAVVRLKPKLQEGPPGFEVAEVLNLQTLRDTARQRR